MASQTLIAFFTIVLLHCVTAQFSGSDARHWCCKVDADEPKPLLQSATIVRYEKGTVAVKVGYSGCGTWGTDRCAMYAARYKAVKRYALSYRQTALFRDCPTKNMVCCNQFSLIAGQCIHHTTLNKHVSNIEFLHNLGVLHTGSADGTSTK